MSNEVYVAYYEYYNGDGGENCGVIGVYKTRRKALNAFKRFYASDVLVDPLRGGRVTSLNDDTKNGYIYVEEVK